MYRLNIRNHPFFIVFEVVLLESEPKSMKSFLVMFIGQVFSWIGSKLVQFALVWWLTESTGSASVLAFASIMAIIPEVFLSPIAGVMVDRWNRRHVMMAADAFVAAVTVLVMVINMQGMMEVWHIYAVMFIRAMGAAFHWAAMQASTSLMVPKNQLSRTAGLFQALGGFSMIVAPPLGAYLLATMDLQVILALDVITATMAIVPLVFINMPQPKILVKKKGVRSVFEDMAETVKYVLQWKGILYVGLIAMMINLLIAPAVSLMPILVTGYFKGGANDYAFMQSGLGIGMVIGGITLGLWGGFKKGIITGLVALVLCGVGIAGVGLMPPDMFNYAVVSLFIAGFMLPISNGSFFAVMQSTVPPEMQGRFFTLVSAMSTAMNPIGLIFAGPATDVIGVTVWYVIGGVGMVILGLIAIFVPTVRNIEEQLK